ncbi:MAG: phage tail assembly chaperone [Hyphomicrobiaceae bacterium]|nr:phage tail assembly chaperone [Hyphomicrobiaceae bacterium]
MALGLGLLRLDPRAFWSMTIPEFSAAARAITGPQRSPEPLGRADLAALMTRFPDHSHRDLSP